MEGTLRERVVQRTGFSTAQVQAVVRLKEEGCTVPFMARYRKERTDGMDEVQLQQVLDEVERIQQFEARKLFVLSAIEEQGKLTDELADKVKRSAELHELEDLYLPFKKKRKTKADIARSKGLEGLAKILMKQEDVTYERQAGRFVKGEVDSIEEALQGARDIIAEWSSENLRVRNTVRRAFRTSAVMASKLVKGKEEEGQKYRDYFDWKEPFKRVPAHRLLALYRGETEGFLKLNLTVDVEDIMQQLKRLQVKHGSACAEQIELALEDAYKRLLKPSIEKEVRQEAKDKADETSIIVFQQNLEQLLLSPPLGGKRILALDPGFRTGCKVVCIDEYGSLLHNETLYPHAPQNKKKEAASKLRSLLEAYKIEAIAIGNGTAGRETEQWVKHIRFDRDVDVFVVDESGASIYSASSAGRAEFPDYDVTVRGAVSIGRRLADPLAELVKLDPKSIGVGQYQHAVNQKKLGEALEQVVENCVNRVGVELNTASAYLLRYVSGIGEQLAERIVEYRQEIGGFKTREELKQVPRLGAKAYEQAAGFLRIANADQVLDRTGVHPERYALVKKMAKAVQASVEDLTQRAELRDALNLTNFVSDSCGIPTLQDILKELSKPGRDPRKKIQLFQFAEGVKTIADLNEGQVLPGIVTNVTNFGAFVDIGIKENGLVHISQLKDGYVSNPADVVKLHQHVNVRVLSLDQQRKRIQLTMKGV